jgi:hypothetical protein
MNKNISEYLLELKYGQILKEHQKEIDNTESVFSKYAEMFMNEEYPSPEDTFKEIEELIEIQNKSKNNSNWNDVKQFIESADNNPLNLMEQYCQEIGIEFKSNYFNKVQSKIGVLVLILKKHYNRPRPYQVAYYTKQEFNPMYSSSAISPSFPSGHTIQAYFICRILSFYYPSKKEDIMLLAKMIEDSREILGVHYKSDNLFSRYIVDELCKVKEIKDIYFNESKLKQKKQEQ